MATPNGESRMLCIVKQMEMGRKGKGKGRNRAVGKYLEVKIYILYIAKWVFE